MNEDKAARYQRLQRRARIWAAAWTLLVLAGLLATGGAHALRDASESAAATLPVGAAGQQAAAAALFVLILFAIHEAGLLPAAYYAGVTLDRRYGLSRQSVRGWLRDHARAGALAGSLLALAGLVTVACQYLVPAAWWLAVWAFGTAVSVLMVWTAPVWIFPLFHRYAELRQPALRQRLEELARRAGVPVVGIFEWKLSDRSSRANAALVGLGRTRRVLVSDTLVSDYTADEVEVVLAHELGHHASHDIWRALGFEAAVLGAGLWAADAALARFAGPLGLRTLQDIAGFPVIALSVVAVSGIAWPAGLALSRSHERRADRYALDLTQKPEAFAGAIRRLAARNLAEADPPAWARLLFGTHPAVSDRLAFARGWTQQPRR